VTSHYVLRRLLYGLVTIIGVATIVFFVTHALGDPAKKMLPLSATPEDYANFRSNLGLDEPLPAQYADFLGDLVRLDLGTSIWLDQPAREIVLERLPNTFLLMGGGLLVAILLAFPLGILAALRPGSLLDNATVTLSLVGLSMPQFWLGSVLILVFAVQLGLLPTFGSGGLEHLVLPALALGVPLAGKFAQMVRSTVIDELEAPYALAARAKGLPSGYVLRRHVLRNALVPISSLASVEIARAFAGTTVVVETVFAFPGVGYLAIQALERDDLVLIQAVVLIVALLVVATNLAFDLLHARIDPRIRAGARA